MSTPPPERSLSTASPPNYGSRMISDDDVKSIVEKFCSLISCLEFDEAQKLIETSKMVTNTMIQSGDRIWQQILVNIAQLAAAEQSYFTLSFFSTKFSFTKNHNAPREHYNKIRQDLRRIDDNASSPFSHPEIANNKLRKDIVDYFSYYAAIRLDLIDFYVGLHVKDWRSVVDESVARLEFDFERVEFVAEIVPNQKEVVQRDHAGFADRNEGSATVVQQLFERRQSRNLVQTIKFWVL
uniref:Uncharacterized protein n=1 Tax=Panagrolaimus sp. JU765 TaxID=591449 RepID=A0AC34RS58_9BILA